MKAPRFFYIGAILIAIIAATPTNGRAQTPLCRIDYGVEPAVEIKVEGAFGRAPAWGYLPLRVTIVNESDRVRKWHLRFRSVDSNYQEKLSLTSDFRFESAARAEVTHEVLLPLATVLDETYRQEVQIEISGSGLPDRRDTWNSDFSRDWPAIGISEDLARKSLTSLDEKVEKTISPKYANQSFGLRFKPSDLPGDWRGFIGLDALMITDREWLGLAPPARLAILQWNRLGGRLALYSTKKSTTLDDLGFPGNSQSASSKAAAKTLPRENRSLGHVELRSWNGTDLDVDKTYAAFTSLPKSARELANGYTTNWGLRDLFGEKSFNATFVLIVLLLFGILVGPINLWVLAPPGRRHRLFITTPLLSIGASLIMAAMILVSDGLGGAGKRFTVLNLEPAPSERRAYLIQEQFSRTGLLLGPSFTLEDDTALSPVNLPPSPWSQFDAASSRKNSLRVQGRDYAGDWFRSRSETGHAMRSVRTTRARIEHRGTTAQGEPRLFSSLGFDIETLYYIDQSGEIWKAQSPVTTGSSISLAKSEPSELNSWWKEQRTPASKALRSRLGGLTSRRDLFFAVSNDSRTSPLTTGDFIEWDDHPVLIYGHLLETSSRTASASAKK